jgi:hypothetical protein
MDQFLNYVLAGYPFLWVKSHEEYRVLVNYIAQLSKASAKYHTYTWDVADGIRKVGMKDGIVASSEPEKDTAMDPSKPLIWLDEHKDHKENVILFLKDYHIFLQKEFQDSTFLCRKIRNLVTKFKALSKVLVIISPTVHIPAELEKEVTVIDFKLPTRDELRTVLKGVCESGDGAPYPKDEDSVLDAAMGMTAVEAENAFSVTLVESKKFNSAVIRREKSLVVKKENLLEVVESTNTLDDIGGLENLKS